MLPEWFSDLTLGGMAVAGLVLVSVSYAKSTKAEKMIRNTGNCANTLNPVIVENTRATSELITILREQHRDFKENNEKQLEVLQSLVLSNKELVMLARETLDRVKDIKN